MPATLGHLPNPYPPERNPNRPDLTIKRSPAQGWLAIPGGEGKVDTRDCILPAQRRRRYTLSMEGKIKRGCFKVGNAIALVRFRGMTFAIPHSVSGIPCPKKTRRGSLHNVRLSPTLDERPAPSLNGSTSRWGCPVTALPTALPRFDPQFSLNHTWAMLRGNINRLSRKARYKTKKIEGLGRHLAGKRGTAAVPRRHYFRTQVDRFSRNQGGLCARHPSWRIHGRIIPRWSNWPMWPHRWRWRGSRRCCG
jgi:hypothetical protein